LSSDNIWLRSNDSFVRVSCVRFVYRSFASCIVRSFVCVFRIVRSFHFVRSCIVRSFRVSCVFRIVRVQRSFVFRFVSFVFFVRLRLVRIANLYDSGSVYIGPWTQLSTKVDTCKYNSCEKIC
jgi:hypothetical protein